MGEQKVSKKRTNVKFIQNVLTPVNPKDAYYVNYDEVIKSYMVAVLIGLAFVLYMVLY